MSNVCVMYRYIFSDIVMTFRAISLSHCTKTISLSTSQTCSYTAQRMFFALPNMFYRSNDWKNYLLSVFRLVDIISPNVFISADSEHSGWITRSDKSIHTMLIAALIMLKALYCVLWRKLNILIVYKTNSDLKRTQRLKLDVFLSIVTIIVINN